MFKFLFGRSGDVKTVTETQRQTVERALDEVNAILLGMDVKPKLSFDPATGAITVDLPDQMPDEALALPAPEKAESPLKLVEKAEPEAKAD